MKVKLGESGPSLHAVALEPLSAACRMHGRRYETAAQRGIGAQSVHVSYEPNLSRGTVTISSGFCSTAFMELSS